MLGRCFPRALPPASRREIPCPHSGANDGHLEEHSLRAVAGSSPVSGRSVPKQEALTHIHAQCFRLVLVAQVSLILSAEASILPLLP